MDEVCIVTERIDDIPLLLHQQFQMGIPEVLDSVIDPHGNRQGLSVGTLTSVWLSYILSEADHRMVEVEPWAAGRLDILSGSLDQPVDVKDFTDDRLADILRLLSDDTIWEEVETKLGQRLIRVYELKGGPIRLDSTTASVHHETEGTLLFRRGHSKDHRPDLPQLKVMLGALDPLGMPIATLVVSGNDADDGLYVPAVRRSRAVVGQEGRLYLGDNKMGSLETRGFIHTGGDYYLMPLAQKGKVPELLTSLLLPVWHKKQKLERLYAPADTVIGDAVSKKAAKPKLLGLSYETSRSQEAKLEGQTVVWQERVLVVYSPSLAKRARRSLEKRLQRAQQELLALTPQRGRGKRQWDNLEALKAKVQGILTRRRVEDLLLVHYVREVEFFKKRKYKSRPACTFKRVRYVVKVEHNLSAIKAARRPLGWRLYVTDAPVEALPLAKAVWVFSGAPKIERDFTRLKGHPLGLRPLYVQREDHAKGMVRLLSLGLRLLTLVEHIVREELHKAVQTLTGLYAANPKRKSVQPTTERLLTAFRGITLTLVKINEKTIRHVTPLSQLQRRILNLMGLKEAIYESLADSAEAIPP